MKKHHPVCDNGAHLKEMMTDRTACLETPVDADTNPIRVDDGNRSPGRYDLPAGCAGGDTSHWVTDTPFFYGCLIKYVWRGWDSVSDMTKALDCATRVFADMYSNNPMYGALNIGLAPMAADICVLNDLQYSSYEHRQALALASSGKLEDVKQLRCAIKERLAADTMVGAIKDTAMDPTCWHRTHNIKRDWKIIDTSAHRTGLQNIASTHVLKICPENLTAIDNGRKKAAVCRTDREYNAGDHVIFVVDNTGLARTDPFYGAALSVKYQITHILKHEDFPEGIKEGYAILSIEPVKEDL